MLDLVELLTRLTAVRGTSGFESQVRATVEELWRPYADEVRTLGLGSVAAIKRGTGQEPRRSVMLAAHMDEIGMMVSRLEKGFVHVTHVGGIDDRVLPGQEVVVHASRPGPDGMPRDLPGVIGARPPHLVAPERRDQPLPLEDELVDLGLSPEEVERRVRIGDLISFARTGMPLGDGRFTSRALDNRASVAAATVCLDALQGRQHAWDVYAVATSQEEVSLGGARTSAFSVAPDAAIALDVTFGRGPGVSEAEGVNVDGGPAIAIGPNFHPKLVEQLREAARRIEMTVQTEPTPTPPGTDAHSIQISHAGIPCGLVSIPLRYMHSPVEVVQLSDVEAAAELLAEFALRLPADVSFVR